MKQRQQQRATAARSVGWPAARRLGYSLTLTTSSSSPPPPPSLSGGDREDSPKIAATKPEGRANGCPSFFADGEPSFWHFSGNEERIYGEGAGEFNVRSAKKGMEFSFFHNKGKETCFKRVTISITFFVK